jgi:hypothetical protein
MFDSVRRRPFLIICFDLIRFLSYLLGLFFENTFDWKHTGTDPIYTCASHDIGHVCVCAAGMSHIFPLSYILYSIR